MVYEIDFAPKGSRAARGIRPVRPIWMDVQSAVSLYPVFNVRKGSGRNGRFTYPDDAQNPYGGGPKRNEWVVDRPGVLVATAGHLHPGGLHTDLKAAAARADASPLFRSKAKYFEPAGAVSWDVAMTGTRQDWRVKVRKGDVLSISATYDTQARAPGGSRWGSWSPTWPMAGRARTRSSRSSTGGGGSPTGTCRRTTTTAAGPTRAARIRARSRTAPTIPASWTS